MLVVSSVVERSEKMRTLRTNPWSSYKGKRHKYLSANSMPGAFTYIKYFKKEEFSSDLREKEREFWQERNKQCKVILQNFVVFFYYVEIGQTAYIKAEEETY
jgi:hypothetical protein